ncbi:MULTISPECIES: hypothetical protein [unclassified Janibacter]|uniref:hypothetical protein n=1 Tax=unclassified Janibacter TaxID=2649294 RepID=UPI003D050E6B
MTPMDPSRLWLVRLLRIGALVLLGIGIALWVTPVNSLGGNLIPVGCGSPATPETEELVTYFCKEPVNEARTRAVALAAAAGGLLLLSEVGVARWGRRAWLSGVAVAALAALPVAALSIAALFTTVGGSAADGTLIRCGTPMEPARDKISTMVCGDLAGRRKALALSGLGLAAVALVGGGYVTRGRPDADDDRLDGDSDGAPAEAVVDHDESKGPEA